MSVLGVIPARWASTRLPGKVLADLGGQPLFLHAVRAATSARSLDDLVVATDSEAVVDAAQRAGVRAVLTSAACASGTDRVAEVARGSGAEILVNVQADEPFLDPGVIDATVGALRDDGDADLATAAAPLADPADAARAQTVTVVCDSRGRALYFSRAALPVYRDGLPADGTAPWLRHIGLYAYRRAALLALQATSRTPLERAESLEQLRALETGRRIRVAVVAPQPRGVDTPDDLAWARQEWARRAASTVGPLPRGAKEPA